MSMRRYVRAGLILIALTGLRRGLPTPSAAAAPGPAGSGLSAGDRRVAQLSPLEDAIFVPQSVEAGDQFGASVDTHGNTIVVGAPGDDGPGNTTPDAGAVYVFTQSDRGIWHLFDVLRAPNAEALDGFGASVAISDNTIVVGAPQEDGASNSKWSVGAAYVFNSIFPLGWRHVTLRPSRGDAFDTFGRSVAISGNTIVVGAPGQDGGSTFNPIPNTGAAFVFARSNYEWTQQTILRGAGAERNDNLGSSVAIDSDTVVVGALGDDGASNTAPESGAAYVFTRTNGAWAQPAVLRAANAEAEDQFGASVAISGASIAVGAPQEDGGPLVGDYNAGAAYVFSYANGAWTQQRYLQATNPGREDGLGTSVALDGNTLVVGANKEDGDMNAIPDAGAAYVFTRLNGWWSQYALLRPSNAAQGDQAGVSVAIAGRRLIVGVPLKDGLTNAVDAGAAYAFREP